MTELTVMKKGGWWNRSIIVGQRSWIAPHLFNELKERGRNPEYMMKVEVGSERLRGAVMYLIAGVARPTHDDMQKEIDLCQRAVSSGAKVIYLSSCAVDRWEANSRPLSPAGELYVMGKRQCETIITGGSSGCGYALRAPVIFGPGQRLESDMLLPSIIRHKRDNKVLTLAEPFLPFQMVHVTDLVTIMADLGSEYADTFPITSLHTDPEITPVELVSLAAPGLPMYIQNGWKLHERTRSDRSEIYHVKRVNQPFRHSDVVSTVQWYDDDVPQLVAPGTLLLEG